MKMIRMKYVRNKINILGEDLVISDSGEGGEKGDITIVDSSGDRVDYYIRSTIKNAFEKVCFSNLILLFTL